MKLFEALSNPITLALVVIALRVAYAVLSRVVAPYPRARAIVEAVAALGPDVLRALQQAASAATGRPVASLDARHPLDDRAALLARAEAAERRVAELAGAAPAAAPVERMTAVPPLVVLLAVSLVCAATACPQLPPVSGCRPLSQRCAGDHVEVCSPSQRWHVVGDLTCGAQGDRCEVSDAGVARCVPVLDASADASEVSP